MAIYEKVETNTHTNPDGSIEIDETKTTRTIKKNEEPDYIKIYSKMWCEFNGIPDKYHTLFLALATRMSYCNKKNLKNSQLVNTCEPWQSEILKDCGWKSRTPLVRGLKILCDCGAIRRVARSVYQVNPQYAGKGPWRYNAKSEKGGIEDLIATFNFKKKTVSTKILWSDDGKNTEDNNTVQDAFEVSPDEELVITETEITPDKDNM